MVLGFKKALAEIPAFWWGDVFGAERQFIRVVAGVSVPILDRVSGACVVIGETMNQAAPLDLWVLDASVGQWPHVENDLVQFRRDLKFDHLICDLPQAREVLIKNRALYFGMSTLPLTSYVTPDYALTEVGRATTAQLRMEGRLHMDEVEEKLDWDPEPAHLCLQSAVIWLMNNPSYYAREQARPNMKHMLGQTGL